MEDLIDKLTESDDPDDQHTVIFTPFKGAIPHFEKALREAGFPHIEKLHGGVDPDELDLRRKRFQFHKGIMLCTILYATAFSLEPATTCYFMDREYNGDDNAQAEDRLLPQEGVNPILSNYYTYEDTQDEGIFDWINAKYGIVDETMSVKVPE